MRALTVDRFTVWASGGQLGDIDALVGVLRRSGFSGARLAAVLQRGDVCNLRLLRGAMACLGPSLVNDASLRPVLPNLLRRTTLLSRTVN